MMMIISPTMMIPPMIPRGILRWRRRRPTQQQLQSPLSRRPAWWWCCCCCWSSFTSSSMMMMIKKTLRVSHVIEHTRMIYIYRKSKVFISIGFGPFFCTKKKTPKLFRVWTSLLYLWGVVVHRQKWEEIFVFFFSSSFIHDVARDREGHQKRRLPTKERVFFDAKKLFSSFVSQRVTRKAQKNTQNQSERDFWWMVSQ